MYHVIFTLVNTEKNRDMLEGLVHREMMNLSMIYRIAESFPDGDLYSLVVTEKIAAELGLSEEELYLQALKHTPKLLPAEIIRADDRLFLLSNERKTLGAGVMLYDGILQALAEEFAEDLFVVPSSVHEVFIIPAGAQDLTELRNLLHYGNRNWVEGKEVLSDEIYRYDRRKRSLHIAVNH